MRKGFTLVEMSILLVIAGLISVLVIKSRTLIENARISRDVSKFKKLETGVKGYYLAHGRYADFKDLNFIYSDAVRPENACRKNSFGEFYKKNYIEPADIVLSSADCLVFLPCGIAEKFSLPENTRNYIKSGEAFFNSLHLLAGIELNEILEDSACIVMLNKDKTGIEKSTLCRIDNMIDGLPDMAKGNFRYWSSSPYILPVHDINYSECLSPENIGRSAMSYTGFRLDS